MFLHHEESQNCFRDWYEYEYYKIPDAEVEKLKAEHAGHRLADRYHTDNK